MIQVEVKEDAGNLLSGGRRKTKKNKKQKGGNKVVFRINKKDILEKIAEFKRTIGSQPYTFTGEDGQPKNISGDPFSLEEYSPEAAAQAQQQANQAAAQQLRNETARRQALSNSPVSEQEINDESVAIQTFKTLICSTTPETRDQSVEALKTQNPSHVGLIDQALSQCTSGGGSKDQEKKIKSIKKKKHYINK